MPDVLTPSAGTQTYKVKVYGQERELTLDQLIKAAEKSEGAEERFRLASEKEAKLTQQQEDIETWKESHELLHGLRDKSTMAKSFIKISQLMGASTEQATEMWDALHGVASEGEGNVQPKGAGNGQAGQGGQVDLSRIPLKAWPTEIQEAVALLGELKQKGITPGALATAVNSSYRSANDEARGDVENALDRVPYFRSLFKRKGREARTKLVDRVFRDLEARVSTGRGSYEKHLQEAIADAQAQADLLSWEPEGASHLGIGSTQVGPRSAPLQASQRPTITPQDLGDKNKFEDFLMKRVNFDKGLADQQELLSEP